MHQHAEALLALPKAFSAASRSLTSWTGRRYARANARLARRRNDRARINATARMAPLVPISTRSRLVRARSASSMEPKKVISLTS
jgi:hypothetical protein